MAGHDCFLCGDPLSALRESTRVPRYLPADCPEPLTVGRGSHQVHRRCWDLWRTRDCITESAVAIHAASVPQALVFARGRFTGAWGYPGADIYFAHGMVSLPRSSMIFFRRGCQEVDACDIRGRVPLLLYFLDLVKRDQLAPAAVHVRAPTAPVGEQRITCGGMDGQAMEVSFESCDQRFGLNLTCFLRLDDLEDLRQALNIPWDNSG